MKTSLQHTTPLLDYQTKKKLNRPSILTSQEEYYTPFKAIINSRYDSPPKHIIDRETELKKMKERLNRLVEQTEKLSQQKRSFSEERSSMEKFTDPLQKRNKMQVQDEIDSPIKHLDFLKYQTPKY